MASDVKRRGSSRDLSSGGHAETDATMRPLSVVVTDVLPKDSIEMASAHDDEPVEAFVSNRPNLTLCEGVGSRRSNGRLDHPDPLGTEHIIEAGSELGVPVPSRT